MEYQIFLQPVNVNECSLLYGLLLGCLIIDCGEKSGCFVQRLVM